MMSTATIDDRDRWMERFLPEHYSLRVGASTFRVSFVPVMFCESYNEAQLRALVDSSTWEVSFADETLTSDGRLTADYGLTGKGDAFRVLGSVAWGILSWAREKRPDYLFWWTLCPRRQTLYARMIAYFERRGSGWHRLMRDPFTGLSCRPEVFWLKRAYVSGAKTETQGSPGKTKREESNGGPRL